MRLLIRAGAIAGVAAFSAAMLACGGGDSLETVDADDWVEDVCDEATDFQADLDDAFADFGVVLDEGDPDEIKEAAADFEETTHEVIDDFVAEVETIGKPDIEGGDEVIDAINEHAEDEKEQISDFRKAVEDIDEDDEDDFIDAVFDAMDDVEDIDLRDRFEDIEEDEVDDLIDDIDDTGDCGPILFSS